MVADNASIPEPASELAERLRHGGADVGSVRVVGVTVAWDEDSAGEPILRFNVALADPAEETWPVEEVLEFHRRVDEHARDVALDVPRYVGLEAETQDELDPSDISG